jgi:hypothetical protein
VDQSTLWTARWLAQLPTTAEERQVAEDALHLGDKEMDLAFATAVREVEQHPPALSPEGKEIEARLQKSESAVAADQAKVAQLTAEDGKASGHKKDELDGRLSLAKAQLELDQDEVDDGKEDLGRAGGDQQARIQALTQQHEAASQISDNTHVIVTAPNEKRGLIHYFQQWSALHWKQMQLWRARGEAQAAAARFAAKHNTLAAEIRSRKQDLPEASEPNAVGSCSRPVRNASEFKPEETTAILQLTRSRSQHQKALATLDKRVDDQAELAGFMRSGSALSPVKQRAVVNHALRGIAMILGIVLIGLRLIDGLKAFWERCRWTVAKWLRYIQWRAWLSKSSPYF